MPAQEAAKVILGDVLKVSYVVDPKVQGRVTLATPTPVDATAALRMLEAALRTVGAVLVVRGGVHYVNPFDKGAGPQGEAIVPAPGGSVAGFASRAVQLQYVAAGEMAEILKPLLKDGTSVRVESGRNVIVVSANGAEHEAIMETVRTFDVDWLANRSVAVFKAQGLSVDATIKALSEIMRSEGADQQLVRFLPIELGNAVLAIAKTPAALRTARQWLQRLDATAGRRVQLFSYQMKFAQAAQVLPILTRLLGAEGGAGDQGAGQGSAALRNPVQSVNRRTGARTTSSARTPGGDTTGVEAAAGASGMFGQSAVQPTAGVMAGVSATPAAGSGGQAPSGQEPGTTFRLMVNEPTNTLLIYATEDEYRNVRNLLRTLDVPPRQVLVEATIVEVNLNDTLRYGVQYYLSGIVSGTPISAVLTNGNFSGLSPKSPGFGLTVAQPAKVVIDALNEVTKVNVVSAPNVMVLNNQAARLVVGDQVPIATQSRQDPLQSQVIVNSIELRDTGVIFEVTPRISSSGSVLLDIVQEVSSIKEQADASLTPTVSQRKLSSSVTVEHGETIVLGGLFSTQVTNGRSGFPLLSKLPVIGGAFGTTKSAETRTELIVLITPKIVNDAREARAVSEEIQARLQELRTDAPAFQGRSAAREWLTQTHR